ncbi:MAG: type VI secretion system tip protein VgrG [Pseudomonadales bacterium]|nr:type VI secretion system tip protein VgrG [Pseudomonadales bacterium]
MSRLPANVSRFTFEIVGDVHPFKVLSFTGQSEISALFRYDIVCLCQEPELSLESFLFKAAVLTLVSPWGNRAIHGMVQCCEQLDVGATQSRYRFQIVPAIWLLSQRSGHRIFQQQSVTDIVETLLDEAGFDNSDVRYELNSRYKKQDLIVQYGESEYEFICRLLEQEGIHFHFIHSPQKHEWVLSDSNAVFSRIGNPSSIRYQQEERLAKDQTTITELCSRRTLGTHSAAVSDYNFVKPNLKINANGINANRFAVGGLEDYRYRHALSLENRDAERYRNIREEQLRCELDFIEITSDETRLFAGCEFAVSDHPNPALNSEYLLVREKVEGELPQSHLEYTAPVAAGFRCVAKAIPVNVNYRSAKINAKPRIKGVQTAFVTGPGNNEIYTDKYGRIKVQFHWDRAGRRDENTSCWVRVSHQIAGKEWGAQSTPRVGQEVIVSFEEGDPDRPVVVGAVYNPVNRPPYPLPQQKARSGIISRSAEKGNGFHELRIDDTKGAEKVFIRSEKNFDVRIKNDRKTQVENDVHVAVAADSFTAINKDLHTTIQGSDNLAVGNNFSFNVGGDFHLKVAGAKVTQAGNQLHIKGGMKTTLQAGTTLSLAVGGSFITLDPSGVSIAGPLVRINEGGSATPASGASPVAPKSPVLPDDDNTGQLERLPSVKSNEHKTLSFGTGSAQAVTFKAAARERVALVDYCPECDLN